MTSNAASAEGNYDVGAGQVGGVYAQALLAAATKAKQVDAVIGELDSFIDDVLDKQPRVAGLLASGFIGAEEKAQMLDRALGKKASGIFLNFLKVLARHGRMDCLRAIRSAAREMVDTMHGRVRVKVTTAVALEKKETERVRQSLQAMLGKEPLLDCQIDPAIVGGLVVRVGDMVYDGSIAHQLNRLREQMINRSVHEIQSRRDRFSSATGN